jgi:excisionase family DNA binding protein
VPRPTKVKSKDRDWRTPPEVASLFSVTSATVREWISQGKISAYKVNGYFRIDQDEVVRYANKIYGDGNEELPDLPE